MILTTKQPHNGGMIDGVKRNAARPETFEIPSEEARNGVQAGTWVKVGVEPIGSVTNGERFWVEVVQRTGDDFIGRVDNDLHFDWHGLDYNDLVAFRPEHILNIN